MIKLAFGVAVALAIATPTVNAQTISPRPELSPNRGSSDRSSPSPGSTPAPTPSTPGGTGSKGEEMRSSPPAPADAPARKDNQKK